MCGLVVVWWFKVLVGGVIWCLVVDFLCECDLEIVVFVLLVVECEFVFVDGVLEWIIGVFEWKIVLLLILIIVVDLCVFVGCFCVGL